MSFKIFTDSASNLNNENILKYDITVIPMNYYLEGKEYKSLDVDTFNDEEYYSAIKAGAEVTTSQINPQTYIDYMSPVLKEGKDIIFVGLSSGVSGSFNSAKIAIEELKEEYPKRKIFAVDSLGASLGEGLLAIEGGKCSQNGMGIEETVEHIKLVRKRMYQVFIVGDLKHLRRTGRLSNLSVIIGTVLNIVPILKGNEKGKIVAFEKVRGRKAAIKALAEKCEKLIKNKRQTIGISYAGCIEDAKELINLIKEKVSEIDVILVKHEPATGSHLGNGALALYFQGDENVREC